MSQDILIALEKNSLQLTRLTDIVMDHTVRLDTIETRLEKTATKDDIACVMSTLDHLVSLAEKRDQEVTMLAHGLKRVEKFVGLR